MLTEVFTGQRVCSGIPEDPQAAEVYYNRDGFDSCSEDEETEAPAETLYLSDPQVSLSADRPRSLFPSFTTFHALGLQPSGTYRLSHTFS